MMKKELNDFAEWLWKEKGLSVFEDIEKYISTIEKPKKTFDEFINLLSVLHFVNPADVKTSSRKGNLSRLRGHVVKYILLHQSGLADQGYSFSSKNVYGKLFGINRDHSTAMYFKNDVDFIGEELNLYNKMVNYINNYDIQWYDKSE